MSLISSGRGTPLTTTTTSSAFFRTQIQVSEELKTCDLGSEITKTTSFLQDYSAVRPVYLTRPLQTNRIYFYRRLQMYRICCRRTPDNVLNSEHD